VSKERIQEFVASIIAKINILYTKIRKNEFSKNYHKEIMAQFSI